MKKSILAFIFTTILAAMGYSQNTEALLKKNKAFTGAEAKSDTYRAIFQLDSGEPKTIEKAIRNIRNALKDPRLVGKLQIELIAFSGGTDAYLKGSRYEQDLKDLVAQGVIVAQCENTLHERKIRKDEIYDFIAIVPTGNGELIIRQAEGWAVIKP